MGTCTHQNRLALHPDASRRKVLDLGTESYRFKFDPLAFQGCPCAGFRSNSARTAVQNKGRLLPVQAPVVESQFGGKGDLPPVLRLRSSLTRINSGKGLAQQNGAADGQSLEEIARGIFRTNCFGQCPEHRPGIEAFFKLECNGPPGDVVARDDGTLHGGSTAPCRKQGEVQIDQPCLGTPKAALGTMPP